MEIKKNTLQDVKNLMFGRAVDDFRDYKTLYMNAKKQQQNDNLAIKRVATDKMNLCVYCISTLFYTTKDVAIELLENYNI